ncbi:MAG: sortase B protein-sorting domain-containing protein [Anaerotignum sp.]
MFLFSYLFHGVCVILIRKRK